MSGQLDSFPVIQTAIPLRRYQYGDFAVTMLGDIQSGDSHDYQYIAAFVKEGESQPQLFVVSEKLPQAERAGGSHALRVINSSMDEVMDVDNRWRRADECADKMLLLGAQILGLEQEVPYQLG